MSHVWCHGPSCHTNATTDRVRGSKGSKVLRTRKVKQHTERSWYNPNNFFNYFCSQGCYNDFANTYVQQIIRIAPRTEPLETPINDPVKEDKPYYSSWNITKRGVDTSMEQDYKGYRKDIYMETKTNHDYTRRNRFTGQSIELTKEESEKHDAIFVNEALATIEDKELGTGASKYWDIVRKNLDWFRRKNAKAYMILLD